MKFLNFSKVKKYWKKLNNFFAPSDKQEHKLTDNVNEIKEQTIERHTRRGSSGYKNYTHVLIPVGNNGKKIYRSFKHQKLPGAKIRIGPVIYSIQRNPRYAS